MHILRQIAVIELKHWFKTYKCLNIAVSLFHMVPMWLYDSVYVPLLYHNLDVAWPIMNKLNNIHIISIHTILHTYIRLDTCTVHAHMKRGKKKKEKLNFYPWKSQVTNKSNTSNIARYTDKKDSTQKLNVSRTSNPIFFSNALIPIQYNAILMKKKRQIKKKNTSLTCVQIFHL